MRADVNSGFEDDNDYCRHHGRRPRVRSLLSDRIEVVATDDALWAEDTEALRLVASTQFRHGTDGTPVLPAAAGPTPEELGRLLGGRFNVDT